MFIKIVGLSVIIALLILLFLIVCYHLGMSSLIAGILSAIYGYMLVFLSVKFNVAGIRNG